MTNWHFGCTLNNFVHVSLMAFFFSSSYSDGQQTSPIDNRTDLSNNKIMLHNVVN